VLWSHILIHHTASRDSDRLDFASIRSWHIQGRNWSDIGYHYLVERCGGVYVAVTGRPLYRAGSHNRGDNSTHIGIAFAGDFTKHDVPSEQLECGVGLVAGLCNALDIYTSHIHIHRERRETACPGNFPIDELRARVDRVLGRTDEPHDTIV